MAIPNLKDMSEEEYRMFWLGVWANLATAALVLAVAYLARRIGVT